MDALSVMYFYGPPHLAEQKQDDREDTGCSPEDLPEAMKDREKWRERVRDIRTSGTTWWSYLPTPPLGQDMTQGQFLSGVQQVWIQSFPSPRLVVSPRLKNLVRPTIYPYAGGRLIEFIPFPRVLVLCEMQSVSSTIWTRVKFLRR